MSRAGRSERGAALVEGAFAIPIFFVMVLGLIDFGMLAFESNKASNAARDGARIGIIDYREADDIGSAHYNAIKNEIESKLQGQTIDLEVNCLTPGGADIDCTVAQVDHDRISVKVSWERKAISPLGNALGIGSVEVDGESRMTIVGRPIGGPASPPPPCAPTGITVTPNPVTRTPTNQLENDLMVSVAGTGTCSSETLWLITPGIAPAGANEIEICSSGCLGDTVHLKDATFDWTVAGTARAEFRDSGGASVVDTTFEIEDPIVPAVCDVTDVVVSPDPVQRVVGGANDGTLEDNLAVDVVGSGVCTNLTLTLVAPDGSSTVICGPGNCLGVTAYSAIANNFWTAGTAQARITGEETFTGTFTVTDQPLCTIDSLTVDPLTVAANSSEKALSSAVTATLVTSGACSNLTVTLTGSDGSSTAVLCSGGACGGTTNFTFSDTAAGSNTKDWPRSADGTMRRGTVAVSGDANASVTFEVT